ncbi:MAG: hypothetical protein IKO45_02275 [Clostridia bacterium]|nr:hypothetical protein [Clostridia bacterium]
MQINGDFNTSIVINGDIVTSVLTNNIDIENTFNGDFSNSTVVDSEISILNVLNGEYGTYQRVTSFDVYTGATDITPTQEVQVLQTKDKGLQVNITIQPIPSNYGRISYNGRYMTVE